MANSGFRFRSQFNFSYSAKPVALRAKISFGVSGAPTIVSGTGMGIASVTRNSAGTFTIALTRSYNGLMGVNARFNSGASAPAAPTVYVASDSVTSGSLKLVCDSVGTTPAATDPASGEVMLLEILLNDSSLPY